MELIRDRSARSTAALISVLVIAVIAPAVASGNAPLPKPEDPTIVPGRSLGGVSVGQPMKEAEAAWGNTLNCQTKKQVRGCNFLSGKRGFGSLVAIDGAVSIATINAQAKHREFIFKGPLMDYGTERGDLGLGDKLKRIAKRYPDGKLESRKRTLTFTEDGTQMTFFSGDRKTRRVTGISLVKLERSPTPTARRPRGPRTG